MIFSILAILGAKMSYSNEISCPEYQELSEFFPELSELLSELLVISRQTEGHSILLSLISLLLPIALAERFFYTLGRVFGKSSLSSVHPRG